MEFYRKNILERTQQGFSIILFVIEVIVLFEKALCISRLSLVDQVNHKPILILHSSKDPDAATPLANASTDKGTALKTMKFGACLARPLQKSWYADPADGPVCLSKWDISDAFHRCNLRPFDVGKFTYVIPLTTRRHLRPPMY